MNEYGTFFIMNPSSHFMQPGSVAFIPAWIILLMATFTIAMLFPKLFDKSNPDKKEILNPFLIAFVVGTLMPVFDDLLAFTFGPPFAHHSLFHSFLGPLITYVLFRIIGNQTIAKYAVAGNLLHIFFNFYLDYVTLFFPFTYQEFGLTDLIKISTAWLKIISYPIILILFSFSVVKFFYRYKNLTK